jgi:hypothetical protein
VRVVRRPSRSTTLASYLENAIAKAHALCEMSWLLDKVPGIGKLIASVITASVPDPGVFGRVFEPSNDEQHGRHHASSGITYRGSLQTYRRALRD